GECGRGVDADDPVDATSRKIVQGGEVHLGPVEEPNFALAEAGAPENHLKELKVFASKTAD
ncbi:MAG: hypothetical protein RIS24_2978, partial [Verrucomicrobiota bacterium]